MASFLQAHGSEILSALLGAIAGAAISIPVTIRVTKNSRLSNITRSNQSRATAGGDIVGRDKTLR